MKHSKKSSILSAGVIALLALPAVVLAQTPSNPLTIQQAILKAAQNVQSVRDKVAAGVLSKELDPELKQVLEGVRAEIDARLTSYQTRVENEILHPLQLVINQQEAQMKGLDESTAKKARAVAENIISKTLNGFQKVYWDIMLDSFQFDPALSIDRIEAGYTHSWGKKKPYFQLVFQDEKKLPGVAFQNYVKDRDCYLGDLRTNCPWLGSMDLDGIQEDYKRGGWLTHFFPYEMGSTPLPESMAELPIFISLPMRLKTDEVYMTLDGVLEGHDLSTVYDQDRGGVIHFPLQTLVKNFLQAKCEKISNASTCEALVYSLVTSYHLNWNSFINQDLELSAFNSKWEIDHLTGGEYLETNTGPYFFKVAYILSAFTHYQF